MQSTGWLQWPKRFINLRWRVLVSVIRSPDTRSLIRIVLKPFTAERMSPDELTVVSFETNGAMKHWYQCLQACLCIFLRYWTGSLGVNHSLVAGGFKTQMQLLLAPELLASPTLSIYNSFSMARPFVEQSSQGHLPEEISALTLLVRRKERLQSTPSFIKNNTFINTSCASLALLFLYVPIKLPLIQEGELLWESYSAGTSPCANLQCGSTWKVRRKKFCQRKRNKKQRNGWWWVGVT